jgi:beta-mannosidase
MRRYQEMASSSSNLSGRFVSEFGMEAYPHLSTIVSHIATDPAQQYPGSMTMDYHNRAREHERRLLTYVAENFCLSGSTTASLAGFAHLTQVMQADAMTFAYASWRREWNGPKARKCGGALVWQFNDTWPTMSWSVVDYFRVRKPSFYAIKRCLQPVVAGLSRPYNEWTSGHCDPTLGAKAGQYDLWISNLTTQDVRVDVVVRFVSIKSGRDLREPKRWTDVLGKANATTEIVKDADTEVPHSSGEDNKDVKTPFNLAAWDPYVIHATVRVDNEVVATETSWPHPLKYLDLSGDRGVSATFSSASEGDGTVTVRASRPIHGFVFEEDKDSVWFSDNGFDVVPGADVVVKVRDAGKAGKNGVKWMYVGTEGGTINF